MSESLLGLDEPPQPKKAEHYRVLARKYRPQTFSALIGQDAMVTTLGNAIKRDRLAHAFLLTGVRGVGKTSTARLIAKALNCVGPDGNGGPTIDPCGVCEPCRAIAEGRHIDVIEIDAASHNGVDDVREMTEASRYAAVSARYKIYIIDEVHMMSKPAFNALLKTLEEPPEHVKFLMATTEVNKVPVTVLSRCQRFDLRRIPADMLAGHFARVVEKESVAAEPEALALIARAAEGSARDGLSILDQAIAHADIEGGGVRADTVRQMLGLSDRGATRELFAMMLKGDALGMLAEMRRQYDLGVEPQSVMQALLEMVHGITLVKVGTPDDPAQSAESRAAFAEWAGSLSNPLLHRLWQMLVKGHEEVARATMPIEACEMALLRVVHAATLPDPGELARRLERGEGPPAQPPTPAPAAEREAAGEPQGSLPADMSELAAMLEGAGKHAMESQVRNLISPIRFEPPRMEVSALRPLPAELLRDLAVDLREITGTTWKITASDAPGQPTLREKRRSDEAAERETILADPTVAAAMNEFPGAELEGWTRNQNG